MPPQGRNTSLYQGNPSIALRSKDQAIITPKRRIDNLRNPQEGTKILEKKIE
jgi:hypothetical protein